MNVYVICNSLNWPHSESAFRNMLNKPYWSRTFLDTKCLSLLVSQSISVPKLVQSLRIHIYQSLSENLNKYTFVNRFIVFFVTSAFRYIYST